METSLLMLKRRLAGLGPLEELLPKGTGHPGRLRNILATQRLANASRDFPGFADLVAQLDSYPMWDENDHLETDPNTVSKITGTARSIVGRLSVIGAFIQGMKVPDAKDDQVVIRLPTSDLKQLADDTALLTKALGQVILNSKVNGRTDVAHVEHGSIALILTVGVTAVVAIGSLAWAGAVVFRKIQEGRILEKQVEALAIKNESLKEVKDAQARLLKELTEQEARHLDCEIFGDDADPERLERIKFSINALATLIERGAEISPALTAPESVRNLFPNFSKVGLVESRIKQIPERTTDPRNSDSPHNPP